MFGLSLVSSQRVEACVRRDSREPARQRKIVFSAKLGEFYKCLGETYLKYLFDLFRPAEVARGDQANHSLMTIEYLFERSLVSGKDEFDKLRIRARYAN